MKITATPARRQDAGVTLVEVLVVLVLVGIMAGIVGLSIGTGSRGDIAKQEADLLVDRLNRAADDVILTRSSFPQIRARPRTAPCRLSCVRETARRNMFGSTASARRTFRR